MRFDREDSANLREVTEGEAEPRPRRARRLAELWDGEQEVRASVPVATEKLAISVEGRAVSYSASRAAAEREAPLENGISEGYAILSVTPEGEGETVLVMLSMPAASEDRGCERVKLRLLVEQYASMELRPGRITFEAAESLREAAELCEAVRHGMSLLQYGDQSSKRLAYKLTAKGVDRATAVAAAAYLSERGYIRESDAARRRAECGLRKGWGLRRIREDLRAQGYGREEIAEATEGLNVDFADRCAAVIRKKYGSAPPNRGEQKKMIAALMRLGYDGDEIREALRLLAKER
ncbi:MAG: regulatory protein RecX [Ruminococcaceae bacterium]|nr:regulatory protein RecX [Oscillospiraceae bacterium]